MAEFITHFTANDLAVCHFNDQIIGGSSKMAADLLAIVCNKCYFHPLTQFPGGIFGVNVT